ncbi:MAG: hypothetical protein KBT34_08335 [Prevotella sp.]|nr:hypothetical protein [Candidatus Prevotella equi]
MNNNSSVSTNNVTGGFVVWSLVAFVAGGGIGVFATRKYYSDKFDAIATTCIKLENDINHLKEKTYE